MPTASVGGQGGNFTQVAAAGSAPQTPSVALSAGIVLSASGLASFARSLGLTAGALLSAVAGGTVINAWANPSAFGWPDLTNTGVPTGTSLTTHAGSLTTTANNQVIDSLDISGQLLINHTGVSFTKCKLTVEQINDAAVKGSGTGALVQDCTIIGSATAAQGSYNGVQLPGCVIQRCNISRFENPVEFASGSTLEDSYLHDLQATYAGAAPHYDGVECQSGTSMVVNHNTIDCQQSQNSAVNFSCDSGAISSVTITNNLLRGGNFALYLDPKASTLTLITVDNNRFGRTQQFGPLANNGASFTHTPAGNVYDDDNTAAF